MKASWRKGYRAKVSADTAAKELDKIKEKNGGVLTAGIVVQRAKAKTNPLHKAFEWDNDKAAGEYRLEQARLMLRSIEVVYAENPKAAPVRQYHAVVERPVPSEPTRKVYKSTKEIMQDPVERGELLSQAIREAISFRRKYAELSELGQVFAALDSFVMEQNG